MEKNKTNNASETASHIAGPPCVRLDWFKNSKPKTKKNPAIFP